MNIFGRARGITERVINRMEDQEFGGSPDGATLEEVTVKKVKGLRRKSGKYGSDRSTDYKRKQVDGSTEYKIGEMTDTLGDINKENINILPLKKFGDTDESQERRDQSGKAALEKFGNEKASELKDTEPESFSENVSGEENLGPVGKVDEMDSKPLDNKNDEKFLLYPNTGQDKEDGQAAGSQKDEAADIKTKKDSGGLDKLKPLDMSEKNDQEMKTGVEDNTAISETSIPAGGVNFDLLGSDSSNVKMSRNGSKINFTNVNVEADTASDGGKGFAEMEAGDSKSKSNKNAENSEQARSTMDKNQNVAETRGRKDERLSSNNLQDIESAINSGLQEEMGRQEVSPLVLPQHASLNRMGWSQSSSNLHDNNTSSRKGSQASPNQNATDSMPTTNGNSIDQLLSSEGAQNSYSQTYRATDPRGLGMGNETSDEKIKGANDKLDGDSHSDVVADNTRKFGLPHAERQRIQTAVNFPFSALGPAINVEKSEGNRNRDSNLEQSLQFEVDSAEHHESCVNENESEMDSSAMSEQLQSENVDRKRSESNRPQFPGEYLSDDNSDFDKKSDSNFSVQEDSNSADKTAINHSVDEKENVCEHSPISAPNAADQNQDLIRKDTDDQKSELSPSHTPNERPPSSQPDHITEISNNENVPEDKNSEIVPEGKNSESETEDMNSKNVLEVKNSENVPEDKNTENEPEVKNSENVPEVKNSENVSEDKNTEIEPEDMNSENVPEVKNSENAPEDKDSEIEPEDMNSENVPEVKNSENVPEDKNSEIEPEDTNSENLPEVKNSENVPEVKNSENVPEDKNSEIEPEDMNSENVPEVKNSENVPEDKNSENDSEDKNSENVLKDSNSEDNNIAAQGSSSDTVSNGDDDNDELLDKPRSFTFNENEKICNHNVVIF